MKPLRQLHTDIDGTPIGDCWRTCVAMLLDVDDPTKVPHFMELAKELPDVEHPDGLGLEGAWAKASRDWLADVGYGLDFYPGWGPLDGYKGFAIGTGPSPRGDWLHAIVVYVDGTLGDTSYIAYAADPHPSDDFVAGDLVDIAYIRELA